MLAFKEPIRVSRLSRDKPGAHRITWKNLHAKNANGEGAG
jgi:hypothetical protein